MTEVNGLQEEAAHDSQSRDTKSLKRRRPRRLPVTRRTRAICVRSSPLHTWPFAYRSWYAKKTVSWTGAPIGFL